jgi:hypothetical protein
MVKLTGAVAFASRERNTAEQTYEATKLELLALMWATSYFCYVHGKKCLVRRENAALTYLQNFAFHNSCILRWSTKLSELHFVVEHRGGCKIGLVDAPSRHFGAVVNPV